LTVLLAATHGPSPHWRSIVLAPENCQESLRPHPISVSPVSVQKQNGESGGVCRVGQDFCPALILGTIKVAKVCRDDRRRLPSAEASQGSLERNLHQPQF